MKQQRMNERKLILAAMYIAQVRGVDPRESAKTQGAVWATLVQTPAFNRPREGARMMESAGYMTYDMREI